MITMDKTYKTADGKPMRILCTDANGVYPVVSLCASGVALMHRANGTQPFDERFNLIEVGPYADFKIDEKVMVRDLEGRNWVFAHFARVDEAGRPTAFRDGKTSWTSTLPRYTESFVECRRPTAEELAA